MNDEIQKAPPGPPDAPPAPGGTSAAIPSSAPSSGSPRNLRANWPCVSVRLKYPLPDGSGGEIAEIRIDEPDLETLEAVMDAMEAVGVKDDAQGLTIRQLRPMIAALTGLPDESLKRLHYKDVMALSEAIAPLLEGLTT